MVEEVKKIDWDRYLDVKAGISVLIVGGAFVMAYLGKMSPDLAMVLTGVSVSYNWFGNKND